MSDAHPFRDRAAIVGVGRTEYSRNSGVSTLTLALRAIKAALDDAGLTVADVDGVACHRVGDSAQAAVVAQSLGIRDLRSHHDLWGGGSQSMWAVGSAAMAVATGMAECVVVWRSVNARSEFRMGGTGRPPPDQLEFQYQVPYGHATPPQQFAMIGPKTNTRFEVGINARDLMKNPRLLEQPRGSMCNYIVNLTEVKDVDSELVGCLKTAYESAK